MSNAPNTPIIKGFVCLLVLFALIPCFVQTQNTAMNAQTQIKEKKRKHISNTVEKNISRYLPAIRAGTPVPIPDALRAPGLKDFANMDEISRASTTGGDGNDQGYMGLAADVDTEVREDEPNPYDFVPVEKEPYIDIKELQCKVVYPDVAKKLGIEGKVNIRLLVAKNGKPKNYIIESTDSDLLNNAAVTAVMNAVFQPAVQNSTSIDAWVSIPVVFLLGQPDGKLKSKR